MKQIKPYLFWYITGVIVLVELGFLIFWGQYDESGHTPQEVKAALDTEFKNLQNLYDRAKAGDPQGRFDPEVPLDIKNLTTKYLITERWKQVLTPIVQKYHSQLDSIDSDLVTRSVDLHKAVIDSDDLSSWYTAYVDKSKDILLALKNAGALVLPDEAAANLDLENDEHVRTIAGFYTKAGLQPKLSEHPLLTTRLRIIEKLSEVIIATKGKNIANPVMEKKVPAVPEQSGTAVASLTWRPRDTSHEEASTVTTYTLVLTLQGSASGLSATEAAIEHTTTPVMVVLGATLSEHASWKPGERKSKEIDPMTMVITIEVIDYSATLRQAGGGSSAASGPASAQGQQGPQGPFGPPIQNGPPQSGPSGQSGPPGQRPPPATRPPGPAANQPPKVEDQ